MRNVFLFAVFLGERCGFSGEAAWYMAERELGWRNGRDGIEDLLSEKEDRWRIAHGIKPIPDHTKAGIRSLIAEHPDFTEAQFNERMALLPHQLEKDMPQRRKPRGKPKAQRVADLPASKEDRRESIRRQMAELQRELEAIG
jgi:hypothetical protein